MIRVVVDSNSQIPPSLIERFGITVVPLTVTVDGVPYLEGVDLEADDFYARFESGTPSVATAAPSPGHFAVAYDGLVAAGATEILSIHIGAAISGTVNAALVAAAEVTVPVRVVDTGTASFGVALCAWAAAEAVVAGATIDEAASAAERTAGSVGNVFIVRGLELARAGGRLAPDAAGAEADAAEADGGTIPLLSMVQGSMQVVGHAADLAQAAELMAARVCAAGKELRVGVGVADSALAPFGEAIEGRLATAPQVRDVVRYRVGPSVGAHTGPGTVGVMYAAMS